MLTSILGKKPKTCQFYDRDLTMKLSLAAELSALSILAEPDVPVPTSGNDGIRRPGANQRGESSTRFEQVPTSSGIALAMNP